MHTYEYSFSNQGDSLNAVIVYNRNIGIRSALRSVV